MIRFREESAADIPAIREVIVEAFERDDEARLVDRLRQNGGSLLSIIAVAGTRVVGHIMYSPVTVGNISGAGLAPLCVLPECHRQGIGSALVTQGNQKLENANCPFIVVLGHPGFYQRFGFVPASRHGVACEWNVPDDAFMVKVPGNKPLSGLCGLARYRAEFSMVE